MLKTLIITALFATSVAMKNVSSYTETCIGEFCFTTPGSSEMKNFDEAKSWCMEHSTTLAVVNDSETQAALAEFLGTSSIRATAYINMKLYQHDNNWFLLNGTMYEGSVYNNIYNEYTLYGYLKPNPVKAEFLVEASKPVDLRCPICDFEGTRCQNKSIGYFFFKERCYVKYDNETFTWFKARERCIKNGGDLAQFQKDPLNQWIPPFNTSWLNISLSYWVGIRCNDSSWKYSDNAPEVIYSSWSIGEPNNINDSCVCVDSNESSAGNWTDCNCSAEQQFICLKIVPTTTVITTTPTTTTITSTTTETLNTTAISGKLSQQQIIGLAAGLAGGGLIIIIIVFIVLAVVITRRKRNSSESSESRPAAESNSEDKSHNKVTGSYGKDLYSQVNKPPRKPVKDVYTEVKKHPKNQVTVNNDVYAEVVSDGKQQTNKIESSPEIVYSTPEFTHDAISTSPYSNYEVAARVKDPDMDPTLRGPKTRSIFPTRHANDEEDTESN